MKRTQMTRSTPMRRTGFTTTVNPLARTVPNTPRASALKSTSKPKAPRYTGPSKATRDAVLARDDYTCQRCSRHLPGQPYSLQHRLPRGRQGDNDMANLVTVCGSATTPRMCHDWMEHVDRLTATAEGWLVPSDYDVTPGSWPVLRFGRTWSMPGATGWTEVEPHPKQLLEAA